MKGQNDLKYSRRSKKLENYATFLWNHKLGFLNCKYLQWATLHVDKHIITVKPYLSAMFLTEKNFGICEIFVITCL